MDSHAKVGQFFGCFDGFAGGRHIGHNCRTGQHTIGVGLGHRLIHPVAEAKIVRVYYDSLIHLQQV